MNDPKPLHQIRLWEFQAVRDALVIIAILALIWLGSVLSMVTVPLLIGLGLAYLIEPVVGWLTRWRWISRLRAVLIIGASVALLLGTLLFFTVPPLVRQGLALADNAGGYADSAHAWLNHADRPDWLRDKVKVLDEALAKAGWQPRANAVKALPASVPTPAPMAPPAPASATAPPDEARIRQLVREELAAASQPAMAGESLSERVFAMAKTVGAGLAAFAGGLLGLIVGLGITAVAMVSFSLAWPTVLASGRELIPLAQRDRIVGHISRMDRTVSAFVRGRLIVASIVGCLYAIGWTIVGVPYGLVLGLIVGVLSLVPYLAAIGLPVAWLLLALRLISHPEPDSWYLVAAADGAMAIVWWKVLLFPLIVNFIVQQTEDYVLNPMIQGKATELHPAVIMMAVIAGGSLAGLYGMLLAVPVAACGKILITAELLPAFKRWASRAGQEPASPPAS